MAKQQSSDASIRQQELEKDVKLFLQSGGKIQKIKEGVTGEKHPWLKGKKTDRPCTIVSLANQIAPGSPI